MDLKHTTTTTTTSVAAADSPDTDGETPLNSQLIKPLSSIAKNHLHNQPPLVTYKECLKNHAATIGSHALDGCGEFMPPPVTSGPHEPTSLKCAACGCHRNFHRREHVNDVYAYAPHVLLSFTSSDHQTPQMHVAMPVTPAEIKIDNRNGRKRFRTKFSQDQKEKMYLFAEKVGWKMQRYDDKLVTDFCNEVGIKRGIFKVWMHNNKNTFGKKDFKETDNSPNTALMTTKRMDIYNDGRIIDVNGHDNVSNNSSDQENGGGGVHLHASNNGSSSSC